MDPFEEFLSRESKKVRVRRVGSSTFIEEERREPRYQLPTDFIDALLLRSEPGEHVIVEKGLLRELRFRLDELESEVRRLRLRNRILESALAASILALILSLLRGL